MSELEEVRSHLKIISAVYGKNNERICYFIGTEHPPHDVVKRVEIIDQKKIFIRGEVKLTIRLSCGMKKWQKDHFKYWDEFFKLYTKHYKQKSILLKYSIDEDTKVRNYVIV